MSGLLEGYDQLGLSILGVVNYRSNIGSAGTIRVEHLVNYSGIVHPYILPLTLLVYLLALAVRPRSLALGPFVLMSAGGVRASKLSHSPGVLGVGRLYWFRLSHLVTANIKAQTPRTSRLGVIISTRLTASPRGIALKTILVTCLKPIHNRFRCATVVTYLCGVVHSGDCSKVLPRLIVVGDKATALRADRVYRHFYPSKLPNIASQQGGWVPEITCSLSSLVISGNAS